MVLHQHIRIRYYTLHEVLLSSYSLRSINERQLIYLITILAQEPNDLPPSFSSELHTVTRACPTRQSSSFTRRR